MSIRFLHTADWHIGNSFSRFDREMKTKLRRGIVRAVEMMFRYADMKKIPLVLIAGDVMDDGQLGDVEDLLSIFKIFKKYPDIQIVMITGNHDPLVARNVYSKVDPASFPSNLDFVREDRVISFPDSNLFIYASPLREKNGNYNPLAWIKDKTLDSNAVHVGLGHGSIANEAFGGNDFPLEPNFARETGLDYLALGDWHSYNKINDRTYYPGVPEPMQMGDDGFALDVTIDGPGAVPVVKKTDVRQFKWIDETIEVDETDYDDFRARLERVGDKEIKKLTVNGHLSADRLKQYQELLLMVRDRYMEIDDRVALRPDDPELIGSADGFMASVVRRLMEIKESPGDFPQDLVDPYVKITRDRIHQEADSITPEEIIDRALMWAYGYSKEKQT